ncbi:nucleotidyltransferase substrate binding protein [Shewanella sp. 202IG2-18]|uniref:nucleotidyltransferase substrate binding protein n=1 Tax=Parashewanella hymeniacidonis TaxID=2807618 RepID=UPI001960E49E|nr:nucleotidyltransferase substrate binding protein [Parashewanella hymeniacidonis]MBM7072115.1 nucleotidyltransferase substrate binding protein [Parashewanella hymeniacidonis]
MPIDTSFLSRCIATLLEAKRSLSDLNENDIKYDIFRAACVKEFEIILEQSGKLLKQALVPFVHSIKAAKVLTFKDTFRKAAQFGIISIEEAERWLTYRDNRNETAHDYGAGFAEKTLVILDTFIEDATQLAQYLSEQDYD